MHKNNKVIFLRGRKVILRPLQKSDLPHFVRWVNDQKVARFLGGHWPSTFEDEEKWYLKIITSETDIILVIETLDGTIIGSMGIHKINWIDGTAVTGALIGETRFWGKGFGTDAKMQLLNYVFNTLNLRRITSQALAFNERSIAYSKHCGYLEEGRLREHVFRDGKYWDLVNLGLFKDEWLPCWEAYQKKGSVKTSAVKKLKKR